MQKMLNKLASFVIALTMVLGVIAPSVSRAADEATQTDAVTLHKILMSKDALKNMMLIKSTMVNKFKTYKISLMQQLKKFQMYISQLKMQMELSMLKKMEQKQIISMKLLVD